MAFEQTALAVAKDCGIVNPYFCAGTMFFDASNTPESVANLQRIFPDTQVSNCGDEIAVDFVA